MPPVHRLLFTVHAVFFFTSSSVSGQIQDNSFLIEEAYNQERGVVQHINAFQRSNRGDWEYGFTQEWPLGGYRHQLSYGIPLQSADGSGTGLGDIELNYRYQLAGNPEARTIVTPRMSLLLPTGDERKGRGAGGVGLEANLPVTLLVGERVVTHWNAGATLTPSAHNGLGDRATTSAFNVGGSVIWLLDPSFNLLVEALWESSESVVGAGLREREESWLLNPGFRLALDLPGDLQIVPGLAYTIGLGSAADEDAVFVYLSLEHFFRR
ncbi:MAG TPA: hypothetical protein VJ808_08975 [Gemmatimonadales bacterium]|nr:hypothetical protein [Gemmatimonadales bacterium]